MKNKVESVNAILTGDWHLQETVPTCRMDDFWKAQWRKVAEVSELQKKYQCPIFHAGDLIDHWKSSPWLLGHIVKNIPNYFLTVLGNHDLPQHNIEQYTKSGMVVLEHTDKITLLPEDKCVNWKQPITGQYYEFRPIHCKGILRKITIGHIMSYQGGSPWPGCTDPEINDLFDLFPESDLILVGDNHTPGMAEKDGRLAIIPGSLTRRSAAQIDYKPCVYLYDAENNAVQKHYLGIEGGVISRDHLIIEQERENRANEFLEQLQMNYVSGISFEDNIKQALSINKIIPEVEQFINNWMDV